MGSPLVANSGRAETPDKMSAFSLNADILYQDINSSPVAIVRTGEMANGKSGAALVHVPVSGAHMGVGESGNRPTPL